MFPTSGKNPATIAGKKRFQDKNRISLQGPLFTNNPKKN